MQIQINLELFEEKGYHLPVVEFHVKYFSPARYDDLLVTKTSVKEIKSRSVVFSEVFKDNEKIAEGKTYHICVNSDNKPVCLPQSFINLLRR